MKKSIKIDGKDVMFKANAATIVRYQQWFGSDLLKDIKKLSKIKDEEDEISQDIIEAFTKFAYTMAKQGGNQMPDDVWEWIESFEVFDYPEILPEIMQLWSDSIGATVELKKE